jgi:hypothetical protein
LKGVSYIFKRTRREEGKKKEREREREIRFTSRAEETNSANGHSSSYSQQESLSCTRFTRERLEVIHRVYLLLLRVSSRSCCHSEEVLRPTFNARRTASDAVACLRPLGGAGDASGLCEEEEEEATGSAIGLEESGNCKERERSV